MEVVYIVLAIIGATLINAQLEEHEFPPAYLHLISKVRHHCLELHPISDLERQNARNGIFDDNDEEIKKYVSCLFTKSGFADNTLHMNKAVLKAFIPEAVMNGEGVKMIITCSEEARNKLASSPLEDKVWDMLKCVYHKDPAHFILP